jgi:hypothetical protein
MSFDADMLKAHLTSEDDQSSTLEEVDEEDPDENEEEDDNQWFRPHPKFPGMVSLPVHLRVNFEVRILITSS